MKTKKLTLMAMLLSIALIIFVIEAQIPPLAPIPGIKLGLANVITLVSLCLFGKREAFVILTLRILLSSVFTGNFIGFIYSVSGGLLSFAVMCAMSKFAVSVWVTSVFGAIGHNIGQIAAAAVIMKTPQIAWYLPVLLISAIITGVFTGIIAQIVLKRLEKIKENTNA